MAIWTETPEIDGYSRRDILPVTVFAYAGGGTEQRAALLARARREYTWPMRRTKAQALTVDEFFRVSNFAVTSFLLKDPDQYARTGVSLGTSVTSQTVFTLSTSTENARDYPINDAHVVVYDDGVATGATVTVSPDNRTFTLSVAPTAGSVMTADYWTYRRVRLVEGPEWNKLAPDWLEGVVLLKEVVD